MNISSVFANFKVSPKKGPNELENQTTGPSGLEMSEGVRHRWRKTGVLRQRIVNWNRDGILGDLIALLVYLIISGNV